MSQLDRFLLAFRRDLLDAAPRELDEYVRLYWDDRSAFDQAQQAAWASGRIEPFVSLCKARALHEDLGVKTARRLAQRLVGAGRFTEAARVLHDERYRLTDEPAGLLDLARVELGLGHLREALAMAAKARELDPGQGEAAARIGSAVAELRKAQEAAASGGWPEARTVCQLWIEAGATDAALQVLMRVLAGRAPLARDLHSFHEILDTLLSLGRPASPYALFRAMAELPAYARSRDTLRVVCDWLRGGSSGAGQPLGFDPAGLDPLVGGSAALAAGRTGRLEDAIEVLGALTLAYPKAHHLRLPLARFVGQAARRSHPLEFGVSSGRRKVFDVFLFNNELRMLKVKLHEMADWVDHFVLVEARQTFTGDPKPLVFEQNRSEFSAFDSKIIHVVVDAFPPYVRHPWAREFHQRDMGVLGLTGRCHEDDLVIISDSDEVVSKHAVLGFEGDYAALGMERMRYFLNYRQALPSGALKEYASLWRAGYLRTMGLSYARDTLRFDKKAPRLTPAGWHFTSISDASGIAAKMSHTAHQQFAGVGAEEVAGSLARLRSGELDPGWERWDLDERFPAYILQHVEDFADVLL